MTTTRAPDTPYVVVGSRPWSRRVFDETIRAFAGRWHFIGRREDLTAEALAAIKPRYVFFLHWSWKVPEELLAAHECVCFHMTDVPYGRGGSPLQNLIARGQRHTRLTALRMTGEIDAGPVYLKEDLCLEGSAEEIFLRASALSARMIARLIETAPEPVPQQGPVVRFERRRPEQSAIGDADSLDVLHDFIRMLDADGYPRAFIDHGGFRYEFSRAALYDGRIRADVVITPLEGRA